MIGRGRSDVFHPGSERDEQARVMFKRSFSQRPRKGKGCKENRMREQCKRKKREKGWRKKTYTHVKHCEIRTEDSSTVNHLFNDL